MSVQEKIKNIIAFLAILFGESEVWENEIMNFTPDYLIEKFERYILSFHPMSIWGVHPSLRKKIINRYLDKWKIEHDEI